MMNKEKFVKYLESKHEIKRDQYGHYKIRGKDGIERRFKLQKTSVRFERWNIVLHRWHKIWSHFYKNLEITPSGKIREDIRKRISD